MYLSSNIIFCVRSATRVRVTTDKQQLMIFLQVIKKDVKTQFGV